MTAATRITAADVDAARERLAERMPPTPCGESIPLSVATRCRVYCKREYLQPTGSFKERGAANAMMQLSPDRLRRGVVAASAGNHALALAYHAKHLGTTATVVMPQFAPVIKATTCRRLGATVVSHGNSFAEAREKADELVASRGLTYIHGFDDPGVIAGQGTLGLEILDQVPDVEAIIVPVGGAGLLAGVATAVKARRPDVEIIAVEPERMPAWSAAVAAGKPVRVEAQPTLADGLAVGCVGDNAFATARGKVDRVAAVDEASLTLAVLRLVELEKAVVEGAGAAAVAALLAGKLPDLEGKTVVVPLCGGNIDPLTLRRVIEHGMAVDGRLHRLHVSISDRPGGLSTLARLIAEAGASVQELRHDRVFAGADVARVAVEVMVETRDLEHLTHLRQTLDAARLPTRVA
jgi:threonine dehydratase